MNSAAAFVPVIETPEGFHFVAAVTVHPGGELSCDLAESTVSSSITAAVDRLPGGLRRAEVFAVWDFEQRSHLAQAVEEARQVRPARILAHLGGGVLKPPHDALRLELDMTDD